MQTKLSNGEDRWGCRQIDSQSLLRLNASLCFSTLDWLVLAAVHKVAFLEQLLVMNSQSALALILLRHYSTVWKTLSTVRVSLASAVVLPFVHK